MSEPDARETRVDGERAPSADPASGVLGNLPRTRPSVRSPRRSEQPAPAPASRRGGPDARAGRRAGSGGRRPRGPRPGRPRPGRRSRHASACGSRAEPRRRSGTPSSDVDRRRVAGAGRLLAARVRGERDRDGGDGRLQPDAGAVPLRPAAAVHRRPAPAERRLPGDHPARSPGALPLDRAGHPGVDARPGAEQLDRDRDHRDRGRPLDRGLLLGGDGHGLLPHLPRGVPRVVGAEALLADHARRRRAVPRREHRRACAREPRRLRGR